MLVVPPRLAPPYLDPLAISAAAAQGYNTQLAYLCVLIWSLATLAVSAAFGARSPAPPATVAPGPTALGRIRPLELILVFAVAACAYFPLFPSRYAPFIEDQYYLTALSRMSCGQVPFRDFDFSYGPLMLQALWGWTQAFGFSMKSYYGFIALAEGAQFALLMAVLQLFLPDAKRRWLAFLLIGLFLLNTLIGLNWGGARRLVPLLVLLLVAVRPFDWRANIAAGTILGLHLGYSHDYAAAGLIGVGAIYAAELLGARRAAALRAGPTILVIAIGVWALSTLFATGEAWPAYVGTSLDNLRRTSSGHIGFAFHWTVNALAVFALLAIAAVGVGLGLGRGWKSPGAGDRMLLGGLAIALVMAKSGLTRADHWHVDSIVLALVFAVLLDLPTSAATFDRAARRWATALIAVAAATYLFGNLPTGSLYASAYVRGLADVVAGRPLQRPPPGSSRQPALEYERSEPRPGITALARYLAEPQRATTPVMFYGRAWVIAPMIGVCSQDYKLDDVMFPAGSGSEREFLTAHPQSLVVLRSSDYERIYGLGDPASPRIPEPLTPTKQAARWLSTVHYDAQELEARLQDNARDGDVGAYIRSRYRLSQDFGPYVLVAPTS